MKFKRIFKVIPVPIFYVDKVRDMFAGVSYGMWVKIKKEYRDDEGLLQHELTHCKQWYRTFGIHGCMCIASTGKFWFIKFPGWLVKRGKKWKFKAEVEAYVIQTIYCSENLHLSRIDLFAGFIADRYGLDVTKEEAKEALLEEYLSIDWREVDVEAENEEQE